MVRRHGRHPLGGTLVEHTVAVENRVDASPCQQALSDTTQLGVGQVRNGWQRIVEIGVQQTATHIQQHVAGELVVVSHPLHTRDELTTIQWRFLFHAGRHAPAFLSTGSHRSHIAWRHGNFRSRWP